MEDGTAEPVCPMNRLLEDLDHAGHGLLVEVVREHDGAH